MNATEAGTHGHAPGGKLAKIGPDKYGLIFEGGCTGQGYDISYAFIINLSEQTILDAGNFDTGQSNSGDPKWLPSDNGRTTLQLVDMYNPDMSKTCMDCHYAMDGHAASLSPTLGTAATSAVGLETEYQTVNQSMGTHYIGLIHTTATNWVLSPTVNIFSTTTNWSGTTIEGTSRGSPEL